MKIDTCPNYRATQKYEIVLKIKRDRLYEFYEWADEMRVAVRATGAYDYKEGGAYYIGVSSPDESILSLVKLTWG